MMKSGVTGEFKKELVASFASAALSIPFVILCDLRAEVVLSSFFLGLFFYILYAKKAVFILRGIGSGLLEPPYSWLMAIVYLITAVVILKS